VGGFSIGLLGRAAGALFNVLAVPIALRTLGQERYAAFAALFGLATWLTMGNLGIGNATTVLVSEVKEDDRRRQLFWHAVISTLIVVAVVAAIAFVAFTKLSSRLLPAASEDLEYEFALATYYFFATSLVIAVGSTFIGYYLGTLRIEYVNWCAFVAQCAGIIALVILPRWFANMLALCVCVTLGTTVLAIWFIVRGIIDCPPPRSFRYSLRQSLPLYREGVGFLASALSSLFYTGANVWLIALTFGATQLATAAVMSRVVQMYLSLISTLLIPLAPALRNALAASDRRWLRKAMQNSGAFLFAIGTVAACGLPFIGRPLILGWTGAELPSLSDWLLPLATLVAVTTWSYLWIYVCFAIRGSIPVAILSVMELAVISVLFYLLGGQLAPSSSMFIMAGSMMALTGTVLPVIVVRHLRGLMTLRVTT
jgi:O-antigen/teichoic acid export membrane protein